MLSASDIPSGVVPYLQEIEPQAIEKLPLGTFLQILDHSQKYIFRLTEHRGHGCFGEHLGQTNGYGYSWMTHAVPLPDSLVLGQCPLGSPFSLRACPPGSKQPLEVGGLVTGVEARRVRVSFPWPDGTAGERLCYPTARRNRAIMPVL